MIQPKSKTEDLLLSITTNCETLIRQTHTKPQETLDFELTKPRKTDHFNLAISVERSCMLRLLILEVYISFFNITEEVNKFKL